jgi:hypothetical protein
MDESPQLTKEVTCTGCDSMPAKANCCLSLHVTRCSAEEVHEAAGDMLCGGAIRRGGFAARGWCQTLPCSLDVCEKDVRLCKEVLPPVNKEALTAQAMVADTAALGFHGSMPQHSCRQSQTLELLCMWRGISCSFQDT